MKKSPRAENAKVLERGLMVLEHITRSGLSTVRDIGVQTALSRQAVYRIMETLSRTGFVSRRSKRAPYRATLKALQVAGSLSDVAVVADVAQGILSELTRKTGWPVLLGRLDDIDVVVIESTDNQVTHDMTKLDPGDRTPQFRRAAGVVCKAFLDPVEAQRINKRTQQKYGDKLLSQSPAYREFLLNRVRKQRYVIFEPLRSPEGSIAVPILGPDTVYGLELRFIARHVKPGAIKDEFLPLLLAAAEAIAKRLDQFAAHRISLKTLLNGPVR